MIYFLINSVESRRFIYIKKSFMFINKNLIKENGTPTHRINDRG